MKPCIATSILLLLLQVGAASSPQSRKGNIEGVVLRLGSGEAVTGARVTLTRSGAGGQPGQPGQGVALPAPVQGVAVPQGARGAAPPATIPAVLTNSGGRFAFPDLDEGAYTLQVQANGYVPQNYGQRYPGGPGVPIRVTVGQAPSNISLNLIPAGNISGRIRDRSDQPLINIPVQLLRYTYSAQGQRTYQSVGNTRTNDRGDYRFYWVTPGRYYLMAGSPSSTLPPELAMMEAAVNGASSVNQTPVPVGYAFYPGSPDISGASVIDLQPGADLSGLSMTLTPNPPTFRIRGRVVDSRTGQAPAAATVSAAPQVPGINDLNRIVSGAPQSSRNYNAATGTFELRDLLPGTYVVTANVQGPVPAGVRGSVVTIGNVVIQPQRFSGTATAVIPGADVDGVVVTVVPAATLSGRIRADGSLPANITIDRMRVQLMPVTEAPSPLVNNITGPAPKADGTFQLANVAPGDYRVTLAGVGSTFYLKDARFEGNDALASPLHLAGTSSGLLDIVVGIGAGRITGTLSDQRSQPAPVSQVTLVPDRQRNRPDLYRTTITSETGAFTFASIPPGDYRIFSWEGGEPNSWFDPELLARSETKGHAVHVTESSVETVEIKVIPSGGTP